MEDSLPWRNAEWMSTAAVAKYLRVSVRTVQRMAKTGRLTRYSLGPRIVRFKWQEVKKLMEEK